MSGEEVEEIEEGAEETEAEGGEEESGGEETASLDSLEVEDDATPGRKQTRGEKRFDELSGRLGKQTRTVESLRARNKALQESQADLTARLSRLENPEPSAPDIDAEPEEIAAYNKDRERRSEEGRRAEMDAIRVEMRLDAARDFEPEFDELREDYEEVVMANPKYVEQMKKASNPYKEFAKIARGLQNKADGVVSDKDNRARARGAANGGKESRGGGTDDLEPQVSDAEWAKVQQAMPGVFKNRAELAKSLAEQNKLKNGG